MSKTETILRFVFVLIWILLGAIGILITNTTSRYPVELDPNIITLSPAMQAIHDRDLRPINDELVPLEQFVHPIDVLK